MLLTAHRYADTCVPNVGLGDGEQGAPTFGRAVTADGFDWRCRRWADRIGRFALEAEQWQVLEMVVGEDSLHVFWEMMSVPGESPETDMQAAQAACFSFAGNLVDTDVVAKLAAMAASAELVLEDASALEGRVRK